MFTSRGAVAFSTLIVPVMLSLTACDTGQLPPGSELRISPQERAITIADRRDEQGRCFIDPSNTIDEPLIMTLTSAQGSPIGDKPISVYVDYSGNTFPGAPVLALYDDQAGNGNGVIDGDIELISGREDDIARVDTNEYSGDRVLLLRINLSCPFRGDVFAFVDGVTASVDIDVTTLPDQDSEQ